MKKITEFKISLMEKPKDFTVDDEGKGNYIIRSSGTFKAEEYRINWLKEENMDDDEYGKYIQGASLAIYNNLLEANDDKPFDSVGIWLTYEDGEVIENAMDLSVLEAFEQYGQDEIIPFLEFLKMTLPVNESEVSS